MVPSRVAERRSIRLAGYNYASAGGYFVTVVTRGRACLFGEVVEGEMVMNEAGKIAEACWKEIPVHFPMVDASVFAVMPNHVHGILVIHVGATHASPQHASPQHASPQPNDNQPHGPSPGSLGAIVGSFKSAVSRRAGRELNLHNLWQRNYYEHILRDNAAWERVGAYIRSNPAAWGMDDENLGCFPPGGLP